MKRINKFDSFNESSKSYPEGDKETKVENLYLYLLYSNNSTDNDSYANIVETKFELDIEDHDEEYVIDKISNLYESGGEYKHHVNKVWRWCYDNLGNNLVEITDHLLDISDSLDDKYYITYMLGRSYFNIHISDGDHIHENELPPVSAVRNIMNISSRILDDNWLVRIDQIGCGYSVIDIVRNFKLGDKILPYL